MSMAADSSTTPGIRPFLRERFRCRLCWAVALGVFLSILVIEGIILIPSYFSYERDELSRVETAGLTAIRSLFSLGGPHGQSANLPADGGALVRRTILKGAVIHRPDGTHQGAFGELPDMALLDAVRADNALVRRRIVSDQRMDVAWPPDAVGEPFLVVARLDIEQVGVAVRAFVWRIVGLVMMIATFLTISTMIVLNHLVLTPILQLRRNLEVAGDEPANPDRHALPTDRRDELGSVFVAFNSMTRRIADGLRALRAANDTLEERIRKRTATLRDTNRQLEQEIGERTRAEEEIRNIARFPQENDNPVLRAGGDGVLLYANPASKPLLAAWDTEVGKPLTGDWPDRIRNSLACDTEMVAEMRAPNERLYSVRLHPMADAGYVNIYGLDITERKDFEEQLMHLANYDRLTGLPNRGLFRDRLERAVSGARRSGRLVAVMSVGLDGFKRITETLGHDRGDELIRMVGQELPRCIPETATAARYGGDVFSVMLTGMREAGPAADTAQRILDCFARPFTLDGNSVDLTASIGISFYPADGEVPELLVDHADLAMFRARADEGNGFRFFEMEMDAAIGERRRLLRDLRHATERGELEVYYQPQVDLGSGRISGMEALVRWHHPELGLVSPGTFIPLAEESRFIVPIGLWVLRTACAQTKEWRDQGLPPLKVAVNLSAVQFREPDLVDQVRGALGETGLDAEFLELEITESVAMHDADATVATMEALHGLGLSLSIDDFGTGYSSLGYLKRFPTGKVKVDQSFVRDMDKDPDNAAICNGVIRMSHGLDMKVLAEGVETEAELELLREQRCDAVQGYFFGRPLPADAFAAEVRKKGERWTQPAKRAITDRKQKAG
jgi:diguanylate cyclase (GGDEF)-like protein